MKCLSHVGLMVLLGYLNVFSTQALNRCLVTHRDAPCKVSGPLPITLECRYPGQWFQVKKTEIQKLTGVWEGVAMETTADTQCTQSKNSSGKNFACEVSRLGDKGPVRHVRITYFCWEFDRNLLGGFGRKRNERMPL